MNLLLLLVGIPIRTFYDMSANPHEYEGWEEYSQIIKRAKDTISLMENSMAADGSMPAPVWIFRAKNYQKMKDVQQIEAAVTPSGDVPNNAGEMLSALPEVPNEKSVDVDSKENSAS